VSLPDGYRPPDDDDALLAECNVSVFQASGPGGQHRNRSRTAVRLVHGPSGIVVIGRRERSQRQNLKGALARLRDRIVEQSKTKTPRRETKPTRASKDRRIEAKKRRSDVKRLRGKPTET
jgi:protein subunit release factor A